MKLVLIFITSIRLLYADGVSIISQEKIDKKWSVFYKTDRNLKDLNRTLLLNGNISLNHTSVIPPSKEIKNTVMFLIDASAPMKKEFHGGIIPAIKQIVALKNSWDKWAVASFAENFQVYNDFNHTNIVESLKNITVRGQRTELFRSSLEAIKLLGKQKSKQKFLFIFSDGDAEDNAYTYKEVIKQAIKEKVTIVTFGYKDSIHLQNLRRISEETGGKLFVANKKTFQLPLNYLEDLQNFLNSSGLITFDVSILHANETGKQILNLKLIFEDNSSAATTINTPVQIKQNAKNLYYFLVAGGVVLIGVLFLLFRKKQKTIESTPKPIAYFQSSSGIKQYIYKNHISIGALADNDIVIEGEYISRHHATLDYKDGNFYIVDTNSANKVFVNYKEVVNSQVNNGDTISFGPYEVVFKIISTYPKETPKLYTNN